MRRLLADYDSDGVGHTLSICLWGKYCQAGAFIVQQQKKKKKSYEEREVRPTVAKWTASVLGDAG